MQSGSNPQHLNSTLVQISPTSGLIDRNHIDWDNTGNILYWYDNINETNIKGSNNHHINLDDYIEEDGQKNSSDRKETEDRGQAETETETNNSYMNKATTKTTKQKHTDNFKVTIKCKIFHSSVYPGHKLGI